MSAADAAIIRLCKTTDPVAPGDRLLILSHIAAAKFSSRLHPAARWDAGGGYAVVGATMRWAGHKLVGPATLLASDEAHVLKRIQDGEWSPLLDPASYLADIAWAASHPSADLWVGVRRTTHLACVFTHSQAPPSTSARKFKASADKVVFVVYDADAGALSSCYLVKAKQKTAKLNGWIPQRNIR